MTTKALHSLSVVLTKPSSPQNAAGFLAVTYGLCKYSVDLARARLVPTSKECARILINIYTLLSVIITSALLGHIELINKISVLICASYSSSILCGCTSVIIFTGNSTFLLMSAGARYQG